MTSLPIALDVRASDWGNADTLHARQAEAVYRVVDEQPLVAPAGRGEPGRNALVRGLLVPIGLTAVLVVKFVAFVLRIPCGLLMLAGLVLAAFYGGGAFLLDVPAGYRTAGLGLGTAFVGFAAMFLLTMLEHGLCKLLGWREEGR